MRLNELSPVKQDSKVDEQHWDAWDLEIEADLKAGKLDELIKAARGEAKSAEAL